MATLKEEYLDDLSQSSRSFGVIVRPSGSGKSTAVVVLCNHYPEGVLYHEVIEPERLLNLRH